jgi:hypothetical protein
MLSGLTEGNQNILIRAVDRAGNLSTPAPVSFVVDRTKPLVEILSGPTNPTKIKDAVFTFRASDPGSTDPARIARVECQLDGGAWLSCLSPGTYPMALEGLHTFSLRATDSAGNLSDVKSYTWLLDSLPPAINFSKQPLSVIPHTMEAELMFVVTDSGTGVDTVRCGLKGQLQACLASDTRKYANLAPGDYIFVVEAKDKIGNLSTKEAAWRVELATVAQVQDVVVTTNNRADILVVIDNSGSMNPEQASMAARFGTFLDQLKNLDWQVAIVTTDVDWDADKKDGRFLKFSGFSSDTYILNSSMNLATAKQAFSATIQRPRDEGSWNEQGIRATYRAIERSQNNNLVVNSPNRAFFRSGAAFAALVVTDANETNSAGTLVSNIPENLIKLVNTTWSGQKPFSYHSIIVRPGDSACLAVASNEGYGHAYDSLSKLTGGVVGSVCATDYSSQLTQMGQGVIDLVRSATLRCQPLDTTGDGLADIKITTANMSAPPSYVVDGTKITFAAALPAGTNRLEYTCLKPAP